MYQPPEGETVAGTVLPGQRKRATPPPSQKSNLVLLALAGENAMSRESLKSCDRLIVALDVDTREEAFRIVEELDGLVSFFKIGYQLFLSQGLPFVQDLIRKNKRTFLDL